MSIGEQARENATKAADKVTEAATTIASEAKAAVQQGAEQVADQVGEHSDRYLNSVSGAVRSGSVQLREDGYERTADAFERASNVVSDLAQSVRSQSVAEVAGRLTEQCRRNPVVAAGVLAGAGFLIAALLRNTVSTNSAASSARSSVDEADASPGSPGESA